LAITPVPRPVSLKNASIPLIKVRYPTALFSDAALDTLKGTVAHMQPPVDAVQRGDQVALPGFIVFPRYVAGSATQWLPVERHVAVLRCVEQSFNYSLQGETGFNTLVALSQASHCHSLQYSQFDEALPLLRRALDNWTAPAATATALEPA